MFKIGDDVEILLNYTQEYSLKEEERQVFGTITSVLEIEKIKLYKVDQIPFCFFSFDLKLLE